MMIPDFISCIKTYYATHKRPFPWRDIENPYYVFISEVMLQQTQTHRVIDKFQHFIVTFPTVFVLAAAPLSAVLAAWQGLGYNRRAKFLHRAAQQIVALHGGCIPSDPDLLVQLPGIGLATAASIAAFAYNKPTVFIETNIRAVFIHFFFKDMSAVHDRDILPLVIESLDRENPRQWYYALMDYGVMLKKEYKNPSRQSRHHVKQSTFQGSDRQVRGAILRYLTTTAPLLPLPGAIELISAALNRPIALHSFNKIIDQLIAEDLIMYDDRDNLCIYSQRHK